MSVIKSGMTDEAIDNSAAFSVAEMTKMTEEMKLLRDETAPELCRILSKRIKITQRSLGAMLRTSRISLRHQIEYEQQKQALARQQSSLATIESAKSWITPLLAKAKEQSKQMKRLEKAQEDYKIALESMGPHDERVKDLEEKMAVALNRCRRSKETLIGTMEEVNDALAKMQEGSEWQQKQNKLDDQAMKRAMAAEATAAAKPRARNDDDWLPDEYKKTSKRKQGRKRGGKARP